MTTEDMIAALGFGTNRYTFSKPINFPMLSFLKKYLEGHRGFIAGGCFKNILSREKIKDIDIFFESRDDFQEAVDYFNSIEGWQFVYRNEKACSFRETDGNMRIELIESIFGTPEFILDNFDFTVAKFAYFMQDMSEMHKDKQEKVYEPMIIYHKDFFEHLHMKRLVIDNEIPFPISTWERSYRYKGYGYDLCRESKQKLLDALRMTTPKDDELSMYSLGGWD